MIVMCHYWHTNDGDVASLVLTIEIFTFTPTCMGLLSVLDAAIVLMVFGSDDVNASVHLTTSC